MAKTLLIVPTRHRPKSCDELLAQFSETAQDCDILFGIDEDDFSPYSDEVMARAAINPRLRMCGTLNLLAAKHANDYEYLAFMGDDHRPMTKAWDTELAGGIGERDGVAYGNDLLQRQNLPTAVLMSASIVRSIGYMAPPELIHMYMDNFWKMLGQDLNHLIYRDDVIIEHLHPIAGKAQNDAGYVEVNSPEVYSKDLVSFEQYIRDRYAQDLQKILNK
jgi:hypothetical protein